MLIAVATGAIVVAQGFRSSGLRTDVGPARFPIIYATILIILCGVLIVRNFMSLKKGDYDPHVAPISGVRILLVFIGIVATFVQYLSMDYIGYPLAMAIYLCFLMALMGMRHKILNPVLSIIITAALYFAFDYLLNVPLPVGILFS